MQTPETREFPLADILSVTTPYLLSQRSLQGVCDLVDWMTFSAPTPHQIDLQVWTGFKVRKNIARASLLRQHPRLKGACPQPRPDEADLIAWLIEQERVYGDHLTVERAEIELRDLIDTMAKAIKPIGELLQELAAKAIDAAGLLGQLAAGLGRIDTELRQAEAVLPQHPDLAELDPAWSIDA